MIPHRQTKFVAEHGAGNCRQAVMASILDLPLEEVIDTADPEMRARGFWPEIWKWCAKRGLKLIDVDPSDERLKGRYSVGVGPSPRGPFFHAVVCKNGVMVFDPHPSDDGVEEFQYHQIFEPLTDQEKRQWEIRFMADEARNAA